MWHTSTFCCATFVPVSGDVEFLFFHFLTKGKIKKCGCFHFSSYIGMWCFYFFVWCFCGLDFLPFFGNFFSEERPLREPQGPRGDNKTVTYAF